MERPDASGSGLDAIDWNGFGPRGPVLGAGVAAGLAYLVRATRRGNELPPGGEPISVTPTWPEGGV